MSEVPAILDSNFIATMTKEEIRDFIFEIEEACKGGDPIEVPVEHRFSYGVYAREMKVPQGALIVGKIHKHQNMNIISEGEVSVLSIDGVIRVKAPYTFVSAPGAKRVIYVHENATWTTIHGTHETDVEKIEEEFIAKNYEEIESVKEDLCLGLQSE